MPAPLLIRRTALLAKIEVTAGVDPTPTGAANAILIRNATLTALEQELEERDFVRPYLGNSESIMVAGWNKLEFEIELAGAGGAGTVPKYGPLLRACGFAETVSAGVSVAYSLVSTAFEHITTYVNVDGVLYKSTYGAGSMSLQLTARKIPVMRFALTGLYLPVVDAAPPTPVYTGFQKPLAVNNANTPTFSLHGYAGVPEELVLDLKNEVVYRNLPNRESVDITDRKPAGSISLEAVKVADKDWWTTIAAAGTGTLQMVHGTAAGNIVQIDAAKVQLVAPKFADSNGVQMMRADLKLVPGASGNDELTLTVK